MGEEFETEKRLSNEPLVMKAVITRDTLHTAADAIGRMKMTAEAKMKTIIMNADTNTLKWLSENDVTCFGRLTDLVSEAREMIDCGELVRLCATLRLKSQNAVESIEKNER